MELAELVGSREQLPLEYVEGISPFYAQRFSASELLCSFGLDDADKFAVYVFRLTIPVSSFGFKVSCLPVDA
jgi:hypothetical protein